MQMKNYKRYFKNINMIKKYILLVKFMWNEWTFQWITVLLLVSIRLIQVIEWNSIKIQFNQFHKFSPIENSISINRSAFRLEISIIRLYYKL